MDDELTPQQAERVRRLLAEARHDQPMPDDVVARLDQVLADLADDPESRPTSEGAPVVRLAERRRKAGRLLLAAAAVVVGGVAVGQVFVTGGDEAAMDSGSAGEAEDQALEAPDRAAGRDELDSGAGGSNEPQPGAITDNLRSISKLPAQPVRPETFARDAESLQPAATGRAPAKDNAAGVDGQVSGSALEVCPPGIWGGGRYLRVSFDREAGWLVYRPPLGETQVVELFLCGEETPERSATIPFG